MGMTQRVRYSRKTPALLYRSIRFSLPVHDKLSRGICSSVTGYQAQVVWCWYRYSFYGGSCGTARNERRCAWWKGRPWL